MGGSVYGYENYSTANTYSFVTLFEDREVTSLSLYDYSYWTSGKLEVVVSLVNDFPFLPSSYGEVYYVLLYTICTYVGVSW